MREIYFAVNYSILVIKYCYLLGFYNYTPFGETIIQIISNILEFKCLKLNCLKYWRKKCEYYNTIIVSKVANCGKFEELFINVF